MSLPKYREIWKRLAEVSQSCLDLVGRPSNHAPLIPVASARQHTFPPLTLTVPPDFSSFIHGFPLPASTAQNALSLIQKAVDEQKALHEKKYLEVCNKFLQLSEPSTSTRHASYYEGMKKMHERSFKMQLTQIEESVRRTYDLVRGQLQPKKPVFNAEYTPVLEQYFEYNAYPSARDRELLARKSSMTARQIEVWFQNHRRRARQEGRSLKRISTDPLPVNISLKTLKAQMPSFMIRKEERLSPALEEERGAPIEPIQRPLSPSPTPAAVSVPHLSLDNIPPSPSAWPTTYSPRDGATFLSRQSFFFEAPVWYRKASSPSSNRSHVSPSLDDLCSDFRSKLHLGGAGSIHKQPDSKYLARKRDTSAAHRHPLSPPAAKLTTRTPAPSDAPVKFGASSLRPRKRHQPYDLSSRKHPNWSLDKPSKPHSTPSRPSTSHRKLSPPIPRTPSLASISSSDSSFCSDPPTPRDSPHSSPVWSLLEISAEFFDCHPSRDPYAFDFSTDTVISSYPSSNERYTCSKSSKPLHSSSLSAPSPYSRSAAY